MSVKIINNTENVNLKVWFLYTKKAHIVLPLKLKKKDAIHWFRAINKTEDQVFVFKVRVKDIGALEALRSDNNRMVRV